MKKFMAALAAGSILLLALTSGVSAQNLNNVSSRDNGGNSFTNDKSADPGSGKAAEISINNVNARALRNFKKDYNNTGDAKWFKNEFGLTARYTSNDITSTVYFDKKGNWEGCLKNYPENKMDRYIRSIVKQSYYDYRIVFVEEVQSASAPDITTYLVHIDGDNDFKIVRIVDGAMDVYQEYEKQH